MNIGSLPTPRDIAKAKRQQQIERAEVTRLTGITFADEAPWPDYTILCPRCNAKCGGANKGLADREFARHYVTAHVQVAS